MLLLSMIAVLALPITMALIAAFFLRLLGHNTRGLDVHLINFIDSVLIFVNIFVVSYSSHPLMCSLSVDIMIMPMILVTYSHLYI